MQVPGGNYLHTYAVDLVRGADGQWWVLADRTQVPTGMGFALENRTVVSRVLPEVIQAVQPRALSTVLRARREALRDFPLRARARALRSRPTQRRRHEAVG